MLNKPLVREAVAVQSLS